MDHAREHNRSLRPLLVGSLAVLCALLVWSWNSAFASPAFDDDFTVEVYGRIDSFPAGLVGTWVVDGVTYAANGSTEFEQEDGVFAVGKCVKVEYFVGTSPRLMREVETENESDCGGGTTSTPGASGTPTVSATPAASETPDATPSPSRTPGDDDDDHGDDDNKVKGIVESLPDSGLFGTWIISGVEYVTNASTEFEQDEGPFVVGACVEAEFTGSAAPFVIVEIETEDMDDCGPDDGTPGATGTPSATGTPTGELELYGRIDSFPADLVGEWVIDGVPYAAVASTEFEPDFGPFAVGACVKIHANPTTSPATLREIETERDYHCSGSGDDDDSGDDERESEIFGVIQSFPAGLIGTWNVAGLTFVADEGTEFDQDDGSFAVGATVKVEFVVEDGVNRATEIETKFAHDDDDSSDDDSFQGEDGHTYGVIDSFPAELVGTWTVSGIDYMATSATEFEQEDGAFGVGVLVKVEYHVTSDGTRVAEEIETTDDNGGVSPGVHFILFGYVNEMPTTGFIGPWVIGSSTFLATNDTIFVEDDGLLGLGAYVGVEYTINNGVKVIYKLETHVPPGAGDDDLIAPLESVGVVRAAQVGADSQWTIGGRSYTVTPATDINERGGPVAVGATVSVNSFSDDNGNEIATQVAGISLSSRVLLPIVAR